MLSLNTWHGGTKINGGLQLIADMIISTQASIVLLSEAGTATTALADMLTKSGTTFYGAASSDVGILSKFPIEETADLNSMIKAVVTVDGKQIAAYSAHLAYTSYATYLPRGYGAGVPKPGEFSEFGWNKMPSGPVTDPETVQRVNINSGRPKAISDVRRRCGKRTGQGQIRHPRWRFQRTVGPGLDRRHAKSVRPQRCSRSLGIHPPARPSRIRRRLPQ